MDPNEQYPKRRRVIIADDDDDEIIPEEYVDDTEIVSNPDELLDENPSDEEEGEDLMENWMRWIFYNDMYYFILFYL